MRFSRGRMFQRRALYRINKWKGDQAKLKDDKTKKTAGSIQKKKERTLALKKKTVGGDRNGKERLVRTKRFVSHLVSARHALHNFCSIQASFLSNRRTSKEILRQTQTIRWSSTPFPSLCDSGHGRHSRCW